MKNAAITHSKFPTKSEEELASDAIKVLTSVDHVQNESKMVDFLIILDDFSELSRLPTYKSVVI